MYEASGCSSSEDRSAASEIGDGNCFEKLWEVAIRSLQDDCEFIVVKPPGKALTH